MHAANQHNTDDQKTCRYNTAFPVQNSIIMGSTFEHSTIQHKKMQMGAGKGNKIKGKEYFRK